jgi:predicted O-methyltransferase YrrM
MALRARLARTLGLLLLPRPVARFYAAALRNAELVGDERALEQGSTPISLMWLLRFARGRRQVVEIGTSAGWAALALALADPRRHVVSVDPFPHPHRERYAALVPPETRERVEFIDAYGEAGPPAGLEADFLFIDEAHEHAGVVACFRAWRAALVPGALVVFHDYDPSWPGVVSAVDELGLRGRIRASSFIWRAPG